MKKEKNLITYESIKELFLSDIGHYCSLLDVCRTYSKILPLSPKTKTKYFSAIKNITLHTDFASESTPQKELYCLRFIAFIEQLEAEASLNSHSVSPIKPLQEKKLSTYFIPFICGFISSFGKASQSRMKVQEAFDNTIEQALAIDSIYVTNVLANNTENLFEYYQYCFDIIYPSQLEQILNLYQEYTQSHKYPSDRINFNLVYSYLSNHIICDVKIQYKFLNILYQLCYHDFVIADPADPNNDSATADPADPKMNSLPDSLCFLKEYDDIVYNNFPQKQIITVVPPQLQEFLENFTIST